ncbi:helix-turn-helix domain-containing protein [Chryseobacterium indologenes]|uniref:helix-turn-helix domain-containing protein n=1 Tax=Chryseobacterium indologenes TaxID=253 RepID=UPI002D810025|nr:helix-turn-helix domain-containing protein [Chryseobacterium indologenes]MEB4760241.1 helix-turn-helix domain-containing protein [Chryseobacterium indologenes]
MEISIVTKEDLQQLKNELLEEIKTLLEKENRNQKEWLRSSEVRTLLNISAGTLQTLRINGSLSYTKVGGTLYYSYKDIQKLLSSDKK